jgi:hypothetical protein
LFWPSSRSTSTHGSSLGHDADALAQLGQQHAAEGEGPISSNKCPILRRSRDLAQVLEHEGARCRIRPTTERDKKSGSIGQISGNLHNR